MADNNYLEFHAVAVGEMFDAVNFYGPFENFEIACDWAEKAIGSSSSWWVVRLENPEINKES